MRLLTLTLAVLLMVALVEPAAASQARRYYRLEGSEAIIGGVAGGLADYFQVDRTLVRAVWAVAAFSGVGLLLYLVLWVIAPTKSEVTQQSNLPANERGHHRLVTALNS